MKIFEKPVALAVVALVLTLPVALAACSDKASDPASATEPAAGAVTAASSANTVSVKAGDASAESSDKGMVVRAGDVSVSISNSK